MRGQARREGRGGGVEGGELAFRLAAAAVNNTRRALHRAPRPAPAQIIQLDEERNEFVQRGLFDHPYPATKVQWAPEPLARERDLLATTGDYLRLWAVQPVGDGSGELDVKPEAVFNNVRAGGGGCRATHHRQRARLAPCGLAAHASRPTPLRRPPPPPPQNKNSDYCAPLTGFDWNAVEPALVATASIDTTVSIWDVRQRKVKTQLIAHDKEVYDVAWARSKDVFATVGADGSLRMFDLRSLEHSTIMYDTPGGVPLLRLAWNPLDQNYIATFAMAGTGDDKGAPPRTVLLDIRMPSAPVAEIGGHQAAVNGCAWAPHSAAHLCTIGDDCQALIWDLSAIPKPVEDPILAYQAEAEVNALVWSPALPEWVAIAYDAKVQMLKV